MKIKFQEQVLDETDYKTDCHFQDNYFSIQVSDVSLTGHYIPPDGKSTMSSSILCDNNCEFCNGRCSTNSNRRRLTTATYSKSCYNPSAYLGTANATYNNDTKRLIKIKLE